jgi:hypothetical protein
MGQAGDQPGGGAYIHALIEEAAYLQAHDEKPATIPPPPPDPAQFKCWFCRKPHQQVQTLFGAEYPVRGPQQLRQRDADLHLRRVRCQVRGVAGPGGTEDPRHAIGRRAGRDRPCRVRPANSVPGRGGLECRRHQRPNGTGDGCRAAFVACLQCGGCRGWASPTVKVGARSCRCPGLWPSRCGAPWCSWSPSLLLLPARAGRASPCSGSRQSGGRLLR